MKWCKAIVCLLFGFLGVHKFMEKKIGMGILYLFTVGLFGIGWIADIVRCFIDAWKSTKNKNAAALIGVMVVALAAKAGMNVPAPTVNQENIPSPSPSAVVEYMDDVESGETGEGMKIEGTATIKVTPTIVVPTSAMPTNTPTAVPTAKTTVKPTVKPTEDTGVDYIINISKSSKKFHEPGCSSVKQMSEKNKWYFHGTRQEVIDMGYKPCGKCNP